MSACASGATTVATILQRAGVSPAGTRAQLGWREFLRAHADSIFACDLLTVGTLWLGCLYVLFLLELDSRRVQVAGCTANPDGRWTARQLAWVAARASDSGRFLIQDRASKLARGEYLRRLVLKRVGWLDWPCVSGRRPRPNGIDAPPSAREMRD